MKNANMTMHVLITKCRIYWSKKKLNVEYCIKICSFKSFKYIFFNIKFLFLNFLRCVLRTILYYSVY